MRAKRWLHAVRRPAGALLAVGSLAYVRDLLPFPIPGHVIPIALLAVVPLAVWCLLPVMVRELGKKPRWWFDDAFFVVPLLIYLGLLVVVAPARAPDGDEPYYLLLAHSLVDDLDVDLADEYAERSYEAFLDRDLEPQPGDPVSPDGAQWSRHNALLPILLAPGYALAGRTGALVIMAVLAALLAARMARWCAELSRPSAAVLAWAVGALTPPVLIYAHQVWVEIPAALCVVIALERLTALERRDDTDWRAVLWIVVPLAVLPLFKFRFLLVAVPIFALAVWRLETHRRWLLRLAAIPMALVLAVLALNMARYGHPLKLNRLDQLWVFDRPPIDLAHGLFGLFFDAPFGLFAVAPIWLLLIPAVVVALRRRPDVAWMAALVTAPTLVLTADRLEWYGAWAPPFRYGVVLVPVLAVLLAVLFAERRRPGIRAAIAALLPVTFVLWIIWVLEPSQTYHLADGGHRLVERLATQREVDLVRLVPSMVRPRPATWVWPLVTIVVMALAIVPRRPRRWAGTLGTVVLCLVIGTGLLAGSHLPTRVIEAEDAWVRHQRGRLYPQKWTMERPRYRGGWTLVHHTGFSAPVIPGGESVLLEIDVRYVDEAPGERLDMIVSVDRDEVHVWPATGDRVWQTVTVGPIDWPDDARLAIHARSATEAGQVNGVIVDQVRLRWR